MINDKFSKEEILHAIKEGIREAFLEMTESRDVIINEQIMKAITDGVRSSFPSRDTIEKCIWYASREFLSVNNEKFASFEGKNLC